jgi:hypothetical protein
LPSWIWPAISVAGLVIYFFAGVIGHIPQFKAWAYLIKPLGIATILGGVFMFGGAGVTSIYEARVKDLESQIQVAAQKSQDTNVQIKTVYVDRVKVVKDTQIKVVHDIKQDAVKMDSECKVDALAIKDLNEAAKGSTK